LEKERLLFDRAEQAALYDALEDKFPSTPDQKKLFDAVMDAVHNPHKNKRFFMLAGVAGAGKTLMARKLAAAFRSEGRIVKICAATTLAAMLYEGGHTAHNLFKFQVQDEEDRDPENPPTCQ
jgi:signal recognition particle GTPase